MDNNLAPIVLFVYNRPWHTVQTLEALHKNAKADRSVLYIFADGPKDNATEEELEQISATRKIIRSKQWCEEVNIIEKRRNEGLAVSIIAGVTEIVSRHGKVIVLEDDIVTSKGFLRYMNDALTLYDNETRVMHVSGYTLPVESSLPSTFFYNTNTCWGWGTWRRAWVYFNNDAQYLLSAIDSKGLKRKFNLEDSYPFYNHLEANIDGRLNTWAVKWYASFFLLDGLSLHPYPSLVNNIGHDGTGVHCEPASEFLWSELTGSIEVKKIKLKENPYARKLMAAFYRTKLYKTQPVHPVTNFFYNVGRRLKCGLKYVMPEVLKRRYREIKKDK
jgi:hypothetical protein